MILITGATGFLGRELLLRLLGAEGTKRILLLIRNGQGESAEQRGKRLIRELQISSPLLLSRIEVVAGDVTLRYFGLGSAAFESLARRVSEIYHCAASTNLNQSLEESRAANVAGSVQVIELAQRAMSYALQTLHHVSTAFVAGDTNRIVRAHELNTLGPFRNSYEQSKAEAEALVRASDVPHCIYRPSVIVGNSISGRTSAFNVIYIPARCLIKGLLRALPASRQTPFDVVPVNYVADALVALSQLAHRARSCYHLTIGLGREPSPCELIEMLFAAFEKHCERGRTRLRPPNILSEELLALVYHSLCVARTGVKNLERLFTKNVELLRQLIPLFPYMIKNPRFDDCETTEDLRGLVSPPPLFSEYAERVFRYCFDTDWGRAAALPGGPALEIN